MTLLLLDPVQSIRREREDRLRWVPVRRYVAGQILELCVLGLMGASSRAGHLATRADRINLGIDPTEDEEDFLAAVQSWLQESQIEVESAARDLALERLLERFDWELQKSLAPELENIASRIESELAFYQGAFQFDRRYWQWLGSSQRSLRFHAHLAQRVGDSIHLHDDIPSEWLILNESRKLTRLLVEACDLSRSYWEDPSYREVDLSDA